MRGSPWNMNAAVKALDLFHFGCNHLPTPECRMFAMLFLELCAIVCGCRAGHWEAGEQRTTAAIENEATEAKFKRNILCVS